MKFGALSLFCFSFARNMGSFVCVRLVCVVSLDSLCYCTIIFLFVPVWYCQGYMNACILYTRTLQASGGLGLVSMRYRQRPLYGVDNMTQQKARTLMRLISITFLAADNRYQ